ncbi:MAG: CDP-glucose 4,6-dehydratase [Gammaproteobacteria bacterium]|jgi:CDP-glucose 4,6-dehydratase|nr:CDP-glucose 4,6-dehydratase [Gammaproteobacteria bacterium]MBT4494930.1 CDP-glucose 4,6-dehydratase [Gammaproteobacteria bacterium]
MVNPAAWSGKKVLVTGHTGFKGSWLCHWLADMGAEVTGYALLPTSAHALFDCIDLNDRVSSIIADINDEKRLSEVVRECSPDVVFHLAAQSLVRLGYQNPVETFTTNVVGTANVLNALQAVDHACDVVIITSDKCYLNTGEADFFAEDDPLGGYDPYSASKACAEIVTASFRQSYFEKGQIGVSSARAGNVIGGGDWADDRLIPDMIRAWGDNKPLKVRNPGAVRPWQHVLEPLSGYLMLAEKMRIDPESRRAWNFGPRDEDMIPVMEVLKKVQATCPEIEFECTSDNGPHEAAILKLDSTRARRDLGWEPRWCVDDAVNETMAWYRAWRAGNDMVELTSAQISRYCESP